MSISASLANALTGLTAASRAAELVSSNVSNAMTEGYARREIELSSRVTNGFGSGVRVDGVLRVVDEAVLRERRLAEAGLEHARTGAEFYDDLLGLLGQPGEAGSLTDLQASFEASLLQAVSRPDSDAKLAAIVDAANAMTTKLNSAADGIQSLREDADAEIAREVDRLNTNLARVADLNAEILRLSSTGASYPDLLDQRQLLVDEIAAVIPIRQLPRENGAVALYSLGGATLLDVKPATFTFQTTKPITADMTLGSGALSGIALNGQPVSTSGANTPLSGGRLAGLFDVRDNLAVSAQADLDEVARDLVARFEPPGPDPTLSVGDPALFTDGGNALIPVNVTGLSARVALNSLVDPGAGGDLWRLRDGLGAVAAGPVGNAVVLTGLVDAVADERASVGGSFGTALRSQSELLGALVGNISQSTASQNSTLAYASARFDALRNEELALGVDTDQEMQKLLLIEQAYAANARVIQTVDELIQTLIGL